MIDRPRYWILDERGDPQPCDDVLTWGHWFETADRHVAQDMDEGDGAARVRVSTVFLGLDHSWFDDGPPLLYETLVFGGPLDGEMRRYATRDDAYAGHREVCALVRARKGCRFGTHSRQGKPPRP